MPLRVLYIEDSEALAEVLRHSYRNMFVTWAATLAAGRRKLEQEKFDVVLLDLNLPDSSGMATVAAMMNRDVPVVVLTGDPSKEFAQMALKAGVTDYISKKVFLDIDIETRLEFAVEKYHTTQRRHASFSFGEIESIKRFISCPPLCEMMASARAV